MRSCRLLVPALGWAWEVQEDTSTLLSLKIQMETGVEQLLDSVGNRNVTQMAALLQGLVEEKIEAGQEPVEGNAYEGGYDLDQDVADALEMIKNELLEDIRAALKDAHKHDQIALHTQLECFAKCDSTLERERQTCDDYGATALQYCSEHYYCRLDVKEKYIDHIKECRALDNWVHSFKCPIKIEEKCVYDSDYICHDCEPKFYGLKQQFGAWLAKQVAYFESSYEQWQALYGKCNEAYHKFIEADAECDLVQRKCETYTCKHGDCEWYACPIEYTQCRAGCIAEYHRTNKNKDCLEKDRKIDWSATEKIECFVDVLIAKPSKEELLDVCGTADCYNKYREHMYHECNKICPEVDFEKAGELKDTYTEHDRRSGKHSDIDVTNEGIRSVNTSHRGDGENRCTSHLDLDFQKIPCATPCNPPENACTDEWTEWHYGRHGFLSTDLLDTFDMYSICYAGEHTEKWAHNLCDCRECTARSGEPSIPLGTDDYCPTATTTRPDYVTTTQEIPYTTIEPEDPDY